MNFALSILTGLLLILAFPKFDYTFLAPFALAPLLFAMAREPRPKRRFLYGWCAGVVYWFGVCYWIRWVLLEYGGLGPISSWGAFLLFALAKGLHMAVFAALAGLLMNRWWAIPAVAALWTGIERTHAPLGFAWLALGNAASDMGIPMRLAPIFGVYGVSFVLAIMSVALAAVLLKQPRNRLFWLAVLPALYLLPALPPPEPPRETAVAVQPNIDEHNEWTSLAADELHQRLASLSLKAALAPGAPPASMILWPEAPAPIYYDSNPTLREHIATLARTTGVPVLFGTVGHTEKGQPLNSAMMVLPSGQPDGRYDKVHLVPFGEFIPPLFGFVTRITQEAGDFVPGDRGGGVSEPGGCVHLLRVRVPALRARVPPRRRAGAGESIQRRLLRPHRGSLAAPEDRAHARGREPAVDPARDQRRDHRIHRPGGPPGRSPPAFYRAGAATGIFLCGDRHRLHPLGRLVRVVVPGRRTGRLCRDASPALPSTRYRIEILIRSPYSRALARISGGFSVSEARSRTIQRPFTITSRTSDPFSA